MKGSIAIHNEIKAMREKQAEAVKNGMNEEALRIDGQILALETQLEDALEIEDNARKASMKPAAKDESKVSVLAKFMRASTFRDATAIVEGTDADGGYAVPEDMSGYVENFAQRSVDLRALCDNRTTRRDAGRFPFIGRASGAMSQLSEATTISDSTTPVYSAVTFAIKKYGALYPVSKEELEDTDSNFIPAFLNWVRRKCHITRNSLITAKLKTFTSGGAISSIDTVKNIVNVALANYSNPVIITNGSGFNWFDCLKKDSSSNAYLLNPDNDDKQLFWLNCGARRIPFYVLTDAELPNDTTTHSGHTDAPVFIGDIYEALMFVSRKEVTIDWDDSAGFSRDCRLYRPKMRADVVIKDSEAARACYIQIS